MESDFISLREAAEYEGTSYDTLKKQIQREPDILIL